MNVYVSISASIIIRTLPLLSFQILLTENFLKLIIAMQELAVPCEKISLL